MRRKARRRLIGAIVLVAALVVLLPMVLDHEPKPIGADVPIRIPEPPAVATEPAPASSENAVSIPAPASRAEAAPTDSSAPAPTLVAKTKEAVDGGERWLILDLSAVSYIDSATIGCIMDIYRLAQEQGGALHILAPQARVETMLSMAGVHKIVPIFREEEEALRAFPPASGKQ